MVFRKSILLAMTCLVIVLVASAACMASPDWRIILSVTSGITNNLGNIYVGATTQNLDIKDAADNFFQAPPKPNIQLYELRNDWVGGATLKSDMRAPYTDGTKVWSNWFIFQDQLAEGSEVALSWTPGTDSYALPVGEYKMYVKWGTGVTDLDGNPLDDAVKVYDLTTAGKQDFISIAGSVQAEIRIVCKVGAGPSLLKALNLTNTGTATSAINCAPVVEPVDAGNVNVYFGSDSARKVFKVNAAVDPMTSATLTAPTSAQGNVKGRVALYGGFIYGSTDAGYVVKRNKAGSTTGNSVVAATASAASVPAVALDGSVYVGAGNTVKQLNMSAATGSVTATSEDLGGPVGSPSIPGTDRVWVNAGNSIACLNAALNTVLNKVDLGAPAGNPAALTYNNKLVVTAGSSVKSFDLTTLQAADTFSATGGATFDGSAFIDPRTGLVTVADSAHNLYVLALNNLAQQQKIALGGSGKITGSPVVGNKYIAVAGGSDYIVYLVDKATSKVSTFGANQAALGCVTDEAGHIYFTSSDGNLYVIE